MRDAPFFITDETDAELRLDACLARRLGCGSRAAKRIIEAGSIRVNGKPRPAHFKMAPGMTIETTPQPVAAPPSSMAAAVRLVAANAEFAAFFKPAGLHTARIAGNAAPSLEEIVITQWERMRPPGSALPPPTLLSRLDNPTSGIVAAAFTPDAMRRFRQMEADGKTEKLYLAVVRGDMTSPIVVRNILDTDNRKKTRVKKTDSPDPTRHTRSAPQEAFAARGEPGTPLTLVEARINRGARHQIRAHLAHAGFPILGDTLYGDPDDAHALHLHHACLELPGFSAFCPPAWIPCYKSVSNSCVHID